MSPGSASKKVPPAGNETLIGSRAGRARVRLQNISTNRVRLQKSSIRRSLKETKHLSGLEPVGPGSRVQNISINWVRLQNISINRVRLQKSWTRWSLKETKRLSGPGRNRINPGQKKSDPLVSTRFTLWFLFHFIKIDSFCNVALLKIDSPKKMKKSIDEFSDTKIWTSLKMRTNRCVSCQKREFVIWV